MRLGSHRLKYSHIGHEPIRCSGEFMGMLIRKTNVNYKARHVKLVMCLMRILSNVEVRGLKPIPCSDEVGVHD